GVAKASRRYSLFNFKIGNFITTAVPVRGEKCLTMRSNRSLRLLGQPKAALLSAPVRGVRTKQGERDMAENLPYSTSVGTLEKILEKIKTASVPERFTQDFVNTKLAMKGGTANACIPFLKKLGFVGTDGVP